MNEENNNKIRVSAFKEIFKNNAKLNKILWKEIKGWFILLFFVFLIASANPFMMSGSQGLLINELVKIAGTNNFNGKIIMFTAFMVIAIFVPSIILKIQEYLSRIFYFIIEEKFTILILKKKGEMDIASHEDPKQKDLLNKIMENGVWRTQNFTYRQFYILQNIAEVIIASFVIIFFKWWVFLILFIGLMPEFIVEVKYGESVWNIHSAKAEVRRRYWDLESYFSRANSIAELKLFQNTGYFINQIKELLLSFLNEQRRLEKKKIKNKLWSVSLSQLTVAFAVVFFITEIIKGNIALGTLVFIIISISDLRRSFSSLFDNLATQYQDNLFVTDMFKFLSISFVIKKPERGILLNPKQTPEIVFENVSFKYPETNKIILKNFSLKIAAGEKLALIGINGAGKTTLIKLLCRFYDPTEGRILINGSELKEIDLESWYAMLGALFQDYSNYHFIARDAIAIGRTGNGATIQKVKKAAKSSEADVFIEEWEKNYEQMLGKEFSEGLELSIGQWQKLALARTFYRDPKILILDEPTSSIDAEAEAKIFERLEALSKDRTVILISHRFSTVRHADKIAVIKNGELKELGNHNELLAKGGIYAKLFNIQAEGYK